MVLSKGLFYCILFLYVYGPPFTSLPINISSLIMIPVALMVFSQRNSATRKLLVSKQALVLGITLIYLLLVSTYGSIVLSASFIVLICANIPTAAFVVQLSARYGRDFFLQAIINIAFFSSLLSIALLFSPEFNEILKFEILKYDSEMMQYQLFRGFGLSDELLFSYSIAQSIAFYVCLNFRMSMSRKTIYLAAMFVSIVVNAKIGIVFILFALLMKLLDGTVRMQIKILFISGAALVAYLIHSTFDSDVILVVQLQAFLNEISLGGLDNEVELSIETLFSDMFFLPRGLLTQLFGDGSYVFASNSVREASDSGWVILLHFGGVFLVSVVLLMLLAISVRLYSVGQGHLAIFLAVIFVVANMKGLLLAPKPGMRMFLLCYFYLVCNCSLKSYTGRLRT